MTTLTKIRIMCNDDAENKPNIGHKYSLVYIKGKDLSEYLGNECSSEYFICENKQRVGQIKGSFNIISEINNTKMIIWMMTKFDQFSYISFVFFSR